MRRDRTEATTSKTTAVHVHRELDHFVSWNGSALLVFRVRQTGVRQIKRLVHFRFRHGFIRWVDYEDLVVHFLRNAVCFPFIRFHLHDLEVGRVGNLILQTRFVTGELNRLPVLILREFFRVVLQEGHLIDRCQIGERNAFFHQAQQITQRLFPHAIYQ